MTVMIIAIVTFQTGIQYKDDDDHDDEEPLAV